MHSRSVSDYVAHFIGVLVLFLCACLFAFGGGAAFEVLSTMFNAGRDFIAVDLWMPFQ